MKDYQSLSHTRWDCKYHMVFIPKMRKKRIFGVLRRHLGEMSGPEGILSQQSVWTRIWCERTSGIRKRKTSAMTK